MSSLDNETWKEDGYFRKFLQKNRFRFFNFRTVAYLFGRCVAWQTSLNKDNLNIWKKNEQKGVFKGDSSTRHAQLELSRKVSGVYKSRLPTPDH